MHNDAILFAIERKSWVDLSASIKDGRSDNVNKLISLREKTNCKLIYLIEGKPRHKIGKKFARIPYKNLQSHLDHLMVRDNIFMIHSDDEEDTAARLIEFCTNYLTLPCEVALGGSPGGAPMDLNEPGETGGDTPKAETPAMDLLTTVVKKTDLQIMYNLWAVIPNITSKTATLFIDGGYHISDLILGKIPKENISTLRYPNGTIIGKRADKIIKIKNSGDQNNHKIYCKILAELPMITEKSAAVILTKITFADLLNGKMTIQDLADIQKTHKSKIGKSAAVNIYKFLVKS